MRKQIIKFFSFCLVLLFALVNTQNASAYDNTKKVGKDLKIKHYANSSDGMYETLNGYQDVKTIDNATKSFKYEFGWEYGNFKDNGTKKFYSAQAYGTITSVYFLSPDYNTEDLREKATTYTPATDTEAAIPAPCFTEKKCFGFEVKYDATDKVYYPIQKSVYNPMDDKTYSTEGVSIKSTPQQKYVTDIFGQDAPLAPSVPYNPDVVFDGHNLAFFSDAVTDKASESKIDIESEIKLNDELFDLVNHGYWYNVSNLSTIDVLYQTEGRSEIYRPEDVVIWPGTEITTDSHVKSVDDGKVSPWLGTLQVKKKGSNKWESFNPNFMDGPVLETEADHNPKHTWKPDIEYKDAIVRYYYVNNEDNDVVLEGPTAVIRMPERMKITGVKKWEDANNAKKTRPNSITLDLEQSKDGGKTWQSLNKAKTLTAKNNWQTSWENIDKAQDYKLDAQTNVLMVNPYQYRVVEKDKVSGYTTTQSAAYTPTNDKNEVTLTVKNTLVPQPGNDQEKPKGHKPDQQNSSKTKLPKTGSEYFVITLFGLSLASAIFLYKRKLIK